MSNENEIVDYVVEDVNLNDENLKGWDGSFGPQLPAGEYHVEVANAKIEPNKEQTGQNLVLDLKVLTPGDEQDKTVKEWLGIPNANSKPGVARRLAHVVRDVLEAPLLPSGGFQTSTLIGRQMMITVTIESTKEYDPVRSQEVQRDRMRVGGERKIEGANAPAKAANAPASKPPGAAAQAPKGRPVAAAPARAQGR